MQYRERMSLIVNPYLWNTWETNQISTVTRNGKFGNGVVIWNILSHSNNFHMSELREWKNLQLLDHTGLYSWISVMLENGMLNSYI